MKNVERLPSYPFFRVKMQGMPPLNGWAVQYVSGIDNDSDIKQGFWLTQWSPTSDRTSATFIFESELVMCFTEESVATDVSRALRENAEILTKVVRVGG
jgi:hypothetical protein